MTRDGWRARERRWGLYAGDAIPAGFLAPVLPHVDPTPEQYALADAFLRGDELDEPSRVLLERVTAEFGWTESSYIDEARRQGVGSEIWETTCWIIANAVAKTVRGRARML